MKLLEKQRKAVHAKSSHIYQKPFVFLTVNIAGIFIAVIGIIVCLGMIAGTWVLHSTTKTQTRKIETTIYKYLDKADDGLDTLQAAVDAFEPATNVVQEVNDVAEKNIERLETLRLSLIVFNFGENLDTPIARIDDTIDALKKFKELPELILTSKEQINEKIQELKDKVEETRQQIDDGATRVRRATFYTFLVSFILAGIFFIGEYTLLTRCIASLKKFRQQRRMSQGDSKEDKGEGKPLSLNAET